jgi:hypothetical protein
MQHNSTETAQKGDGRKPLSTPLALLCGAAVFLCAVLPYLSNVTDGFIHDDWSHMLAAQRSDLSFIPAYFVPWKGDFYYRPLSAAYFNVAYRVWGADPLWYRISHMLLFGAGAVMLWLFLLKVARSNLFALFAAVLYALHPLNAESALWLSDTSSLMSILFAFLALWLFWTARASQRRRPGLYVLFLLSVLISSLSKEAGYAIPGVVILLDILLRPGRAEGTRRGFFRSVLWHVPPVLLVVGLLAFRIIMTGGFGGAHELEGKYAITSAPAYFFSSVLPQLPEAIFLPVSRVDLPLTLGMRGVIWMAGGAAILLLAFIPRRMRLVALFGLAFSILMLIPVAGLMQPGAYLRDTRLFLGVVPGFAILLASAATSLARLKFVRFAGPAVLVLIAAAYFRLDLRTSQRFAESAALNRNIITALQTTAPPIVTDGNVYYHNYPNRRDVIVLDGQCGLAGLALVSGQADARLPVGMSFFRKGTAKILDDLGIRLKAKMLDDSAEVPHDEFEHQPREQTFFLAWHSDKGAFEDITEQMRRRIYDRLKPNLPDWDIETSRDYNSREGQDSAWDMRLESGPYRFSPDDKVLYVTPQAGRVIIVRNVNKDISARNIDYLDCELSPLTRGREMDFEVTVEVEWERDSVKGVARTHARWVTYSWHYWEVYRIVLAPSLIEAGDGRITTVRISLTVDADEIGLKRITPEYFPAAGALHN